MQAHQKRISAPSTITTTAPIATLAMSSIYYSSFGGPGGIRTLVQNSFALKGLQQFLLSIYFQTARGPQNYHL
jgi:hypothetical protein